MSREEKVMISAPGVAESGKCADEAAHFQFHESGGHHVSREATAFDDAVHRGFILRHGGEYGGLFLGKFGDFCGGFHRTGLAGEGQFAEVIKNVAGIRHKRGTIADELIATGGCRLIDGTRHGKNRFAVF